MFIGAVFNNYYNHHYPGAKLIKYSNPLAE